MFDGVHFWGLGDVGGRRYALIVAGVSLYVRIPLYTPIRVKDQAFQPAAAWQTPLHSLKRHQNSWLRATERSRHYGTTAADSPSSDMTTVPPSRTSAHAHPCPKLFADAMRHVTAIAKAEDDRMDIDVDLPPERPTRDTARQPLPARPPPPISVNHPQGAQQPTNPPVPRGGQAHNTLRAKYLEHIKHLEAKLAATKQGNDQLDLENRRLAAHNSLLQTMLERERASKQ